SSIPARGKKWWWRSPCPTTSRSPSAGSGQPDPAGELLPGRRAEHREVLLVVLERVARDRVDEHPVVELRTVGPAERFVREALEGRDDLGEGPFEGVAGLGEATAPVTVEQEPVDVVDLHVRVALRRQLQHV